MGEVYRARDTKLRREVAIKVLPSDVAGDPERLARFQREAHLLASLNHAHIAAIHGLEESDGSPFLVLELVEGADLAEHLKRGPLPRR
jgi:eukaryotic-like serine/threonine-protein kinase